MKLRLNLLFSILTSVVLAAPSIAEELKVFELEAYWDAETPLGNPHKGWYHHFPDNTPHKYPIREDRDLTEFPGMDHLYIRLAWSYLEPIEGQFRWDRIDSLIEKWTGHGLGIAFRITSKETGTHPPEQQYATPLWVKAAGAAGGYYRYGEKAGEDGPWEPIYDDPVYMEKLDAFLEAFAARYDGSSWLRYVDIGSLGDWGEGHTWGGSRMVYGYEARLAHLELYRKYFTQTQLVVTDDFLNSIPDPEKRKLMHQYVLDHGLTYRDDSPMVDSIIGQAPETFSVKTPEYFEAVYRERPTIFELDHYPRVKAKGNWTAEPGSEITKHNPGLIGPEYFLEAMKLLRATYIGYHGPADVWLADNPEWSNRLLNRAGYWYFPHRIQLPMESVAGGTVQVKIDWENRGVAPAYHSYDLVFKWEGPLEGSVTLPARNLEWMPSSDGEINQVSYRWQLPADMPAGNYKLKLKMYAPRVAKSVHLPLDAELRDAAGFYDLAEITVAE